MAKKLNTRARAARICSQVIDKGQSLDATLKGSFEEQELSPQDRALVQELVYGVCRWCGDLDVIAAQLLKKPIRSKDRIVHFVLLIGLYQLRYLKTAEHAAVAETVSACQQLNKGWAKHLVNGCLRNFQREQVSLEANFEDSITQRCIDSHPKWMTEALQQAWPQHHSTIVVANNQRPAMCLRVNQRQQSRDDYLAELIELEINAAADPLSDVGIILDKPVGVDKLPRFYTGAVSVQDTAAQLAGNLCTLQPGATVLDACAAPGGKAAHLLEKYNNELNLDALDISERRCEQLSDTLARLQLDANVYAADARDPSSWPVPEGLYDAILVDAPCSGTGVIRRHPDIKHHRRPDDVDQLVGVQAALLDSLWTLLKPEGQLLYMTCSILPIENSEQIKSFLGRHQDARVKNFEHPSAMDQEYGKQAIQGIHPMDGFYYCLVNKAGTT